MISDYLMNHNIIICILGISQKINYPRVFYIYCVTLLHTFKSIFHAKVSLRETKRVKWAPYVFLLPTLRLNKILLPARYLNQYFTLFVSLRFTTRVKWAPYVFLLPTITEAITSHYFFPQSQSLPLLSRTSDKRLDQSVYQLPQFGVRCFSLYKDRC